jgi:hypothetical protein
MIRTESARNRAHSFYRRLVVDGAARHFDDFDLGAGSRVGVKLANGDFRVGP